jgi:hypothetical protein
VLGGRIKPGRRRPGPPATQPHQETEMATATTVIDGDRHRASQDAPTSSGIESTGVRQTDALVVALFRAGRRSGFFRGDVRPIATSPPTSPKAE